MANYSGGTANPWSISYDPKGQIARTLQGGGSSYSSIPANPTGYPSQNYADFGSSGMYSGTPGFSQMFAGMGGGVEHLFDNWSPNQNPNLATQGPGSIKAWGTQNPNVPGSMALDPTWAGGLRGAGMGAETTMGDVIVEGTRPGGIQDWIDEGLIDPGNWKTYDHPSVVETINQGRDNGEPCPQGYIYDPQLQACVLKQYSIDLSGLNREQKINLLGNAQLMYLYQQNKNAASGAPASGAPASGGLLGQVPQTGQDDRVRALMRKYGGRNEPAETYMNQEERNMVNEWKRRRAAAQPERTGREE